EDLRLAVAGDEVDDYDDEGYDDEGYDDGVLLDGGYEDGYDDDACDEDEDYGLELEPEPPLRAGLPDRITIGDDGWVIEEPRPLGRLDSRQRDALAEAELFVAGIGPGHPSLYPDRLQD